MGCDAPDRLTELSVGNVQVLGRARWDNSPISYARISVTAGRLSWSAFHNLDSTTGAASSVPIRDMPLSGDVAN